MIPVEEVRALTGVTHVEVGERVQSLWSGYGEILRVRLDGTPAILKLVRPPRAADHPRGWNTDRSHRRKLNSYAVERCWYARWSELCGAEARVADVFATARLDDEGWLFVLEDLDASGYAARRQRLDGDGVRTCLGWLAEFHATFLHQRPTGLWEEGTYWHLDTRPDELAAMSDERLKRAASLIDAKLAGTNFRTFVHGDAKVANFCFTEALDQVAVVDFQYVGGGCGMKDVAYFLGSCLNEDQCERGESLYLDVYFHALVEAVARRGAAVDTRALEAEWRGLYAFAWADFHRFLLGWNPGHAKLHGYSERLMRGVLEDCGA